MWLYTDPDENENASALQAMWESCGWNNGRGTSGTIAEISSGARVDQQAKQQWNTMALTSAMITNVLNQGALILILSRNFK